jgi:ribose transport system substrate-binding protein
MAKLRVLVSLITEKNDFQMEQAASAEETAHKSDTDIQIIYADNNAVDQTQQLLKAIHRLENPPHAILVEPVGTGMPQVAAAAAAAGIGWAVINREVDYVAALRTQSAAPMFAVSADQQEVGRIQGKQFAAFLGQEGSGILYLEGPSGGEVARLRSAGMHMTKPSTAQPKVLKGDWTEASGYRAVKSWLSLSTSQQLHIRVVGSQNDAMALGARRAFEEVSDPGARNAWLSLPFTGCDGAPRTGQEWVRRGLLAATVVIPPTMGPALELMVKAIRSGEQPPARTLKKPSSFPPLETLATRPAS